MKIPLGNISETLTYSPFVKTNQDRTSAHPHIKKHKRFHFQAESCLHVAYLQHAERAVLSSQGRAQRTAPEHASHPGSDVLKGSGC